MSGIPNKPLTELASAAGPHRGSAFTRTTGIASCGIGSIAIAELIRPFLYLYHLPIGTKMRPMDLEFMIALCTAAGLLLALPLACLCLHRSRVEGISKRLATFALLISIVATVGGYAVYFLMISLRHFVIEE
jgi:hypothetical protein